MAKKRVKKTSKKKTKNSFPKPRLTFGQKSSDFLTYWAGSWYFIILLLVFMFIWMGFNMYLLRNNAWDPYPFILLNFVLSTFAALQAPIILMSQNRGAERDRSNARYDYQVNRKAEREIQDVQKDLEIIKKRLFLILPKKKR